MRCFGQWNNRNKALSSFADNAQDSTQLMFPVTILIMCTYFVSMAMINDFGGGWMNALAYAPFFSPIVAFVTSDLIALTWREVAINVGIQLLEVIVVTVICGKVYRRNLPEHCTVHIHP